MPTLHIHSPAKINLSLRVVGKRADGYHLLQMVMVPLAFGDELEVTTHPASTSLSGQYVSDGIALSTNETTVPLDEHHLCIRAARAMRVAVKRDDSIAVHLIKRIPVGGGLGGGSSNAGAVLRALNCLWALDWTPAQLADIGVRLGADVPFFCSDGPAWVEGIGEKMTPLPALPPLWILLVNPGLHVSTPEIFRALDFKLTLPIDDATQPPALRDWAAIVGTLHNDLEPVTMAKYPVIGTIKQRLQSLGAAALMSGSGATVFGLFPTQPARDLAAAQLTENNWWVCKTQVMGK